MVKLFQLKLAPRLANFKTFPLVYLQYTCECRYFASVWVWVQRHEADTCSLPKSLSL